MWNLRKTLCVLCLSVVAAAAGSEITGHGSETTGSEQKFECMKPVNVSTRLRESAAILLELADKLTDSGLVIETADDSFSSRLTGITAMCQLEQQKTAETRDHIKDLLQDVVSELKDEIGSTLQRDMGIMKEDFINDWKEVTSRHQSDIEGLKNKLDHLDLGINNLQERIVPLRNDVLSEVTAIQSEMQGVKEKQQQQETNLQNSFTEIVEKQGLKQAAKLEIIKKDLTNQLKEVISSLNQLDVGINDLQERTVPQLNDVLSKVKAIQSEMREVKEEQQQQETNLQKSFTKQELKQAERLEKLANQLKEVHSSLSQLQLKLVIFTLCVVLVFIFIFQDKLRSMIAQGTAPGGPAPGRIGPTVPARHKVTVPARHKVTVVTFTRETHRRAQTALPDMLGEACPKAEDMEYRLPTEDLDPSQIPSSRGYIVVIGYDARNSILEDMDGSMGSRKRQTIVELQNTRREVLVIYIEHDPQRRESPADSLYNIYLGRTTTHPMLRQLVYKQRFLSLLNWNYTPHQAEHVKTWVSALY